MDGGALNKRLTIEAPTAARDEFGQDNPVWSPVATVWAGIKPLSGRQLALAQANTITATSTHQVTIRYRPGLKVTHRLKYEQGPVCFPTMTAAQFAALTAGQFAAMASSTETPIRYFSIDAINDTEERHRELVLTCTEDVA